MKIERLFRASLVGSMLMTMVLMLIFMSGCAKDKALFDQCHAAGSFQIEGTGLPMFCIDDEDVENCIKPAANSGFREDLKNQLCSTTQ